MSVKQMIADVNNYIEETLDPNFEGLATDLVDVTDFPELVKELVELANEGMEEYTKVSMENLELRNGVVKAQSSLEDIKKLDEEKKNLEAEKKVVQDLCEPAMVKKLLDDAKKFKEENKKLKQENEKFKKERKTIWETMSQSPALVLLLPDSMYDEGVESESEEEASP